jgi:hypothetical protein
VTDFEACACPLCDGKAVERALEIRAEVRCPTCGLFSISHSAVRALGELSGAGRAVVTETLRAHVNSLRAYTEVPLILETDVTTAAGRLV